VLSLLTEAVSYLGTPDARAWPQQKMGLHEEFKIKISLRTIGLYF